MGEHDRLFKRAFRVPEHARGELLAVVCVVVHHGEHGWNAPRRLRELLDGVHAVADLSGLVPDFEILVDDLAEQHRMIVPRDSESFGLCLPIC